MKYCGKKDHDTNKIKLIEESDRVSKILIIVNNDREICQQKNDREIGNKSEYRNNLLKYSKK